MQSITWWIFSVQEKRKQNFRYFGREIFFKKRVGGERKEMFRVRGPGWVWITVPKKATLSRTLDNPGTPVPTYDEYGSLEQPPPQTLPESEDAVSLKIYMSCVRKCYISFESNVYLALLLLFCFKIESHKREPQRTTKMENNLSSWAWCSEAAPTKTRPGRRCWLRAVSQADGAGSLPRDVKRWNQEEVKTEGKWEMKKRV